jgi:elongation factor 2
MAKESMLDKVIRLMIQRENIRNMGIIAHIDHGKTTLSDSLLAGAGMLSMELAGGQRYLDFMEEEQQRGITIQTSNVNMVHEVEGNEYLINLIDTPGHVDFGGDVTRAMRAVDGALVVVCAVEGAMPQTETVLRQSLKERVKPILFINKVDRLMKELKLTPQQMQERFVKTIEDVNKLIRAFAPKEFAEEWQVTVENGKVAFGTAIDKWALSLPIMKKTNLTFKDILEAYSLEGEEKQNAIKELEKKAPMHEVILDMAVKHFPDPIKAQKYRIPKIWHGDLESDVGKSMLNCDPKGPLVVCITKVVVDQQAGEIAVGRVFSGKLERGIDVNLILAISKQRLQQIYTYKGPNRYPIDEVPAGNIVGIAGLKGVSSGETVTSIPNLDPFEEIKHIFEPVVTKAIEAKNPKDLPKLISVIRDIVKEDPTLRAEINEESGEQLLSGLGELHLEIKEHIIERDRHVPIVTSPPIVVYRETVNSKSPEVEGKSPNKHNKFYITVEPLDRNIYDALAKGVISAKRIKKRDKELAEEFVQAGMTKEEALRVVDVFNDNLFVDMTRGIVHIREIIEMAMTGFEEVMKNGPVAKEPMAGLKVVLHDCKLHEDSIHRGPGQVIPAVRDGIKDAIMAAKPTLLEPVQTIRIDAPVDYMGNISKLIQSRRGQLLDMQQEKAIVVIKAKMPVADSFGFTSELRGSTEGRGVWSLVDSEFQTLPNELFNDVVKKVRQRKGMST